MEDGYLLNQRPNDLPLFLVRQPLKRIPQDIAQRTQRFRVFQRQTVPRKERQHLGAARLEVVEVGPRLGEF